jgi:hypothetical protein
MEPNTEILVIKDEFSGDKKIATMIASTKPMIIVPLTEVNGFIVLINSLKMLIINSSKSFNCIFMINIYIYN